MRKYSVMILENSACIGAGPAALPADGGRVNDHVHKYLRISMGANPAKDTR